MILLDDLLAAAGGHIHGPEAATRFDTFCFDSRLVRPGQIFLAVKTERADGHDYISHACRGGATGVLCQHPVDVSTFGATCIVVPDTRQAIQDWARYVLARQGVEVIGITGSVGKTTAKEAIAAVLDAPLHPVFKNRANYNGLYGLPIALGELRPEHRVAVLEMAADHFGEIARLAQIAPPHIAVVTTVEPAHLEAFGSLEAIAARKATWSRPSLPTGWPSSTLTIHACWRWRGAHPPVSSPTAPALRTTPTSARPTSSPRARGELRRTHAGRPPQGQHPIAGPPPGLRSTGGCRGRAGPRNGP